MFNAKSHTANYRPNTISTSGGFTLVETVVAAVILVIVIVAAVTALRKGVELEVSDNHRREARTLVHTLLEQKFDFSRFDNIAAGTVEFNDTLDRRSGAPLLATVQTITIDDTSVISLVRVPLKKVTVSVRWQEIVKTNTILYDTITIQKWLAPIK